MMFIVLLIGCEQNLEEGVEYEKSSPSSCPVGFSLIQSVDVQQATDSPDLLSMCVMQYEASVIENQAYSRKEAIPSFNISFYDALEFCSSTRIKFANEDYDLHLVHFQHWRDAGDGVPGKEGALYPNDIPYEEILDTCALPSSTSPSDLLSPFPTGMHLDCVSEHQIYDQIGNLWEWVDSGVNISIDDWLSFHQKGIWDMEITTDQTLRFNKGDINQLNLHSTCMEFDSFYLNEDQELEIQLQNLYPESCPDEGEGYIIPDRGDRSRKVSQKEILPIQFQISENRMQAQFKVHVQRDGEPIGIKVGGAYYSGGDVTLQDLFYGHTPEFNGTIGFRCAFFPE